ncbi:MAG: hypothetical protein E7432_09680 [Ruminococcaceae bacterium]|nr:hypothetical protein [Oscillospiraceae bacterium]
MFTPVYIIAGIIMFAVFCVFQYWTLKNGLTRSIKVMPLTFTLIAVFMCLMLYSGAFGESKAMLGFKANELYGLAFGMVSLCALLGDIAGWIVYKATNKNTKPQPKKKKKKK